MREVVIWLNALFEYFMLGVLFLGGGMICIYDVWHGIWIVKYLEVVWNCYVEAWKFVEPVVIINVSCERYVTYVGTNK